MFKKQIGQVTIFSKNETISEKVLNLAEQLKNCYACRTLYKDFNKGAVFREDCIDEMDYIERCNTDYVEYIDIFADTNVVRFGQGDYDVYVKIDDIVIEKVNLNNYEDHVDKIRIAYKEGSIVAMIDLMYITLHKINKEGYGDELLILDKKNI